MKRKNDRFAYKFTFFEVLGYAATIGLSSAIFIQSFRSNTRYNAIGDILQGKELAFFDVNHDGREDIVTRTGIMEDYFYLQKKNGDYEKVTGIKQYLRE